MSTQKRRMTESEAVEGDVAEVEDVDPRGDRKGSRRWAADRWEMRGRKRNGARSDDFGTGCRPRRDGGTGRRRAKETFPGEGASFRRGIGKGRDDGPRTDGRSGVENETARGAMILERDVEPEETGRGAGRGRRRPPGGGGP